MAQVSLCTLEASLTGRHSTVIFRQGLVRRSEAIGPRNFGFPHSYNTHINYIASNTFN
jgi:hypothetical protein